MQQCNISYLVLFLYNQAIFSLNISTQPLASCIEKLKNMQLKYLFKIKGWICLICLYYKEYMKIFENIFK